MMKRIALSIAVVAVAILFSSSAFAGEATSAVEETFLASLQAPSIEEALSTPAEPDLGNGPEPILMAIPSCTPACPCAYQCRACTPTSVKLCARNCTGAFGCNSCQSGTICDF